MSKLEWRPKWTVADNYRPIHCLYEAFDLGVEAGIKATICRYEALINDPKCVSFRQALEQLKEEAG